MEAAPADDAALLARLRAGDNEAYAQLIRSQHRPLFRIARRLLGNDEDARDAVQDAFISAFKSIGTFAATSRLSTWLHRVVINAALMKLRTRRRHPEEEIEKYLPRFQEDGHQVVPSVEWNETAETLLQRSEMRDLVRTAIDQLPETYRTVLLLRDIEELNTEETARMLGITTTAVKLRLHRARQALRTLLDPHMRGAE
jgi:RNA polymerase sigma-70 factor, ECF subfamily